MLERGTLLLEVDYQGETYYLSDTAITNENVYWPYIAEFPSFSIGGDGYLRVNLGSLSILRDEENEFHPFGQGRYYDLISTIQKIEFRLYLNQQRSSLFEGRLALESFSESALSFSIMESEDEVDLVNLVLDEERRIVERFFFEKLETQYRLLCWMPDNPFTDSQEIIFERLSYNNALDRIIYDGTEGNRYLVQNRNINTFNLLLEEDGITYLNLEIIGKQEADLQKISDDDHQKYGISEDRLIYELISDSINPIEHHAGSGVVNPFAFGDILIRTPVVKKGGTLEVLDGQIVNPSFSDVTEKDSSSAPTSASLTASFPYESTSSSWIYSKNGGVSHKLISAVHAETFTTTEAAVYRTVQERVRKSMGTHGWNAMRPRGWASPWWLELNGWNRRPHYNYEESWEYVCGEVYLGGGGPPHKDSIVVLGSSSSAKVYEYKKSPDPQAGQMFIECDFGPLGCESGPLGLYGAIVPNMAPDEPWGDWKSRHDDALARKGLDIDILTSASLSIVDFKISWNNSGQGRLYLYCHGSFLPLQYRSQPSRLRSWMVYNPSGSISLYTHLIEDKQILVTPAKVINHSIPETPAFTYDDARAYQYKIYEEDEDLSKEVWSRDNAFGSENWLKNRVIQEYRLSSIRTDANNKFSLLESTAKTSLTATSASKYVSSTGSCNSPQRLDFSITDTNSSNVTCYRLYRKDSTPDQEISLGFVLPDSNCSFSYSGKDRVNLVVGDTTAKYRLSWHCYQGTTLKFGDTEAKSTNIADRSSVIFNGSDIPEIVLNKDSSSYFHGVDFWLEKLIVEHKDNPYSNIWVFVCSADLFHEVGTTALNESYQCVNSSFLDVFSSSILNSNHYYYDGEGKFELHNPSIDPYYVNVDSNELELKVYDDGVTLSPDAGEIDLYASNNDVISLISRPVGEIAISGHSRYGCTIKEFFEFSVQKLKTYISNLDEYIDITKSPFADTTKVSFYQDSEISIIEMAEIVAKNTNHLFWIQPYFSIYYQQNRKKLVLVDINESLFNEEIHSRGVNPVTGEFIFTNNFDDDLLIKTDVSYPYPIKSIESTISMNKLYIVEADQDKSSSMKSQSVTVRMKTSHYFGNVESAETFGQSISETKQWLSVFSKKLGLPVVSATIRGIYDFETVGIGSLVLITDRVRKVLFKVLTQELSYDFNLQQTSIKGLAVVSKIVNQ